MTEDATLDAFADAGDSTPEGDEADETTLSRSESADHAPVAPTPTSSWRPDGECASCGEHVARRWRNGGEHVCTDCVSWNTGGGDAGDQ